MNNINQNRIVWMMDETIGNSHPANWRRVRELESGLVGLIGNPSFKHELVDPVPCLKQIAEQLRGKDYSCVFDLTGWLTPAMQELFPFTPIENRFSLSRVRVVSSPRLETTGYRMSMTAYEIAQVRQTLDLKKPLIVDDVSFSGWTSRKMMDIWGINPEQATHAFLIGNTGNLGDDQGAVPMLESLGSKVITGHELRTPEEDGWHLKDLHQNPNLSRAFSTAIVFQDAFKEQGLDSEMVKQLLVTDDVADILFPERMTSQEVRTLVAEGKFILKNGSVLKDGEMHARNPFLWASPYFQQHTALSLIHANEPQIVETLEELRILTNDPEGKIEAGIELQREIRGLKFGDSFEGASYNGRERQ